MKKISYIRFSLFPSNLWQTFDKAVSTDQTVDDVCAMKFTSRHLSRTSYKPCYICAGYKLSSLEQMWKVHKINNWFLLHLIHCIVGCCWRWVITFLTLAVLTCRHRCRGTTESSFVVTVIICCFGVASSLRIWIWVINFMNRQIVTQIFYDYFRINHKYEH